MPQALEEIERLRLRIKDLEARVESTGGGPPTPPASAPAPAPASTESPPEGLAKRGQIRKLWQGVYSRGARSQQTSYYGPSSTFYFLSRISSFLGSALEQPQQHEELQPHSASKTFSHPESPFEPATEKPSLNAVSALASGNMSLPRAQEEYFLSLFWQFYFCTLPIVDEGEFQAHYLSLWEASTPNRKPSALVDIMLALCMQYGCALMPGTSPRSETAVSPADSTIAGRWFYHRCQELLSVSGDLESPSITTVQCHAFTAVYLYFASFQNMAYASMSLAVRSAQSLGLHLEPPSGMPPREREMRKRTWWVLSTVDTKICIKLGRPFSFRTDEVTCPMLVDDYETATQPGFTLGTYGTDLTWITYLVHCQSLVASVRQVYESLYDRFSDVLVDRGIRVPYEDPASLEVCAKFLTSMMEDIRSWLGNVPSELKTRRRGDGTPFSLDRSSLDIETSAPLWLQRQRLCLELMYHGLVMGLYRPFITFQTRRSIPITEAHATACINHAIAHTHIMHQVLTETDILNGWHDAFHWQWDATVTLLGFLFAYPISAPTPAARRAVDKAIEAFERFGANNVAVARNAAGVTRNLVAKADFLIDRFLAGLGGPSVSHLAPTSPAIQGVSDGIQGLDIMPGSPSHYGGATENWDFMDLVLTVDSFNNFEDFLTEACELVDV
ncbi:hypothetical protein FSOLCH5_007731 [Fusarium solani]|nr:hypothetical protein NW759_015178 [Fusarium solani]